MEQAVKQMNIYQAISKCMEEIGAVGKNDVNKTQGFKYRGIDAVMNALNPALVRNHIFIVPEVLEQTREERKSIKGSVMSVLIDGTISEAKELGIETKTPDEIERMKALWNPEA